jgi:hypothetical protein
VVVVVVLVKNNNNNNNNSNKRTQILVTSMVARCLGFEGCQVLGDDVI